MRFKKHYPSLITFYLLLGIVFPSMGQTKSSYFDKPSATADSVIYYQKLAEWFQLTPQFNLDSVLYYFDKGEKYAIVHLKNPDLALAIINKKRADFYYRFQMLKQCEVFSQKAFKYYQTVKQKDNYLEYEIKYLIAISKLFNGESETALRVFLEAEKLISNNPKPEIQAQYYNNKSYFYLIYDIDGQDDEIIVYGQKSLEIYKKLNKPEYNNAIGRILARFSGYYELRDKKLLVWYNDESEKYILKARDPYFLAYHILVREEIAFNKKDYDEANYQLTKGMRQLEKYGLTNTNYYQYFTRYMADLKKSQNQLDSAIFYYKKAYDLASKILYEKQRLYNLSAISEVYQQKGDFKNALEYYQQYADRSIKYEIEKSERSLKEHDLETDLKAKLSDLRETKTNRNILLIAVCILLLLLLIIYYSFRNQKKLNGLLSKRDAEKDVLLKEIHHRVKNNLTIISSLLDTQAMSIEDKNTQALMKEGQSRVKSIALIHQKLYQNDNLANVDFGIFLDELYRQIAALFQKQGQNISFINKVSNIMVDIDTAVPLGLITNELLTNSFKYAFGPDRSGEIILDIQKKDANSFIFTFKDNGNGLPDSLRIENVKSMGLQLIQILTKQLSGSLRYEKTETYSIFVINFKDSESRKLE